MLTMSIEQFGRSEGLQNEGRVFRLKVANKQAVVIDLISLILLKVGDNRLTNGGSLGEPE